VFVKHIEVENKNDLQQQPEHKIVVENKEPNGTQTNNS
jgi:hypothetical protein